MAKLGISIGASHFALHALAISLQRVVHLMQETGNNGTMAGKIVGFIQRCLNRCVLRVVPRNGDRGSPRTVG
jgi:hypothetical protein